MGMMTNSGMFIIFTLSKAAGYIHVIGQKAASLMISYLICESRVQQNGIQYYKHAGSVTNTIQFNSPRLTTGLPVTFRKRHSERSILRGAMPDYLISAAIFRST
ncbi:hypothetical protein GGI42DRAFT_179178 [Trichoderma sp. SZMC 28013]